MVCCWVGSDSTPEPCRWGRSASPSSLPGGAEKISLLPEVVLATKDEWRRTSKGHKPLQSKRMKVDAHGRRRVVSLAGENLDAQRRQRVIILEARTRRRRMSLACMKPKTVWMETKLISKFVYKLYMSFSSWKPYCKKRGISYFLTQEGIGFGRLSFFLILNVRVNLKCVP